jgi:CheY-like chemotaxis protein
MNLVVNSRDAMPKGGQLLIETANVKFDVPNPRQDGDYAPPGDYVTITVTDTGSGIEDKDLLHIFDPFFTTKEKGKGTGLGLSTVYGIVKQSGGHIWVSSNKNQGTTFRIYFPVVHDLLDPLDRYISMDTNYHGTETILFVEDEDNLRKLASHVLSKNGYKILEAQSGEKAYEISREYTGKIDLMITDIVMTGMSGYELVELLQKERNSMKIMYISGYLDSTAIKHDLLKNGHAMLQKPFSMDYLASFIREMLDQPEGA